MKFYMGLFEKGTTGAYVALELLGLALIFIFLQAVLSYGRGTSRSVARFFSVVAAAGAAFYVTRIVGRAFIPEKTMGELMPFLLDNARLSPVLEASASELLLPIVFIFVFLLFSLLIIIPFKLFCGIFGFSYERNNLATRLFAILVGAGHALLTFCIVMLPLFACVRAYKDVAAQEPSSAAAAVYEQYVEDTAKSPLYRYPMKYVGNRLLDSFEKAHK